MIVKSLKRCQRLACRAPYHGLELEPCSRCYFRSFPAPQCSANNPASKSLNPHEQYLRGTRQQQPAFVCDLNAFSFSLPCLPPPCCVEKVCNSCRSESSN